MTVEDLLSFRRENGFIENVTIWKSDGKDSDGYEKILEFNPDFYKAISREVLDSKIENYDFEFEEDYCPASTLVIFINQENNTKKNSRTF